MTGVSASSGPSTAPGVSELRALSERARQGTWMTEDADVWADWETPRSIATCDGSPVHDGNVVHAEFIVVLVNAYRARLLVPVGDAAADVLKVLEGAAQALDAMADEQDDDGYRVAVRAAADEVRYFGDATRVARLRGEDR